MIGITLQGWDGSLWDLQNGPLRVTQQTLDMFEMFDTTSFTSTLAYVDGQRFDRWKALPREFDVQIATAQVPDTAMTWYAVEAAFKRVMRPDKVNTLIVSDLAGFTRTMQFRMVGEETGSSVDPSMRQRTMFTYSLVADDPWWHGGDLLTTFNPPNPATAFFGPTGFGPSFFIAPASTDTMSGIYNPGDVDAWPVWTFYGPTPRFEVEVAGRTVSSEVPIAAGDSVTVDTRPFRKSAIHSNGNNVTSSLSSRQYAQVPPGENAPVTVAQYQGATVELRVDSLFFRAY